VSAPIWCAQTVIRNQIPAAQNMPFSGDISQKMPVLRRRYFVFFWNIHMPNMLIPNLEDLMNDAP
jgi:hypothetical protein